MNNETLDAPFGKKFIDKNYRWKILVSIIVYVVALYGINLVIYYPYPYQFMELRNSKNIYIKFLPVVLLVIISNSIFYNNGNSKKGAFKIAILVGITIFLTQIIFRFYIGLRVMRFDFSMIINHFLKPRIVYSIVIGILAAFISFVTTQRIRGKSIGIPVVFSLIVMFLVELFVTWMEYYDAI